MTKAALQVLSRHPNGFVLMVEGALIDKFTHPLDWERAVMDTIQFDQAVEAAKEFAAARNDTLVLVVADHTHGISVVGTIDDGKKGEEMREKVGVYAEAGYPNYQDGDGDGYPDSVNVSRRLALFVNNFPDHYETFRPKLDGTFVPAVKNDKGQYVANEAYKSVPGAQLRVGNLPRNASDGVHTADDVVLTAIGPGAQRVRGFMDNTEVFRVMAEALSLGK
jgi:alkaline phosphatase